MKLGIDASNIRAGGGVTHLVELLQAAHPQDSGFDQVTIWGGSATLEQVADRPWLVKQPVAVLDRGLVWRSGWQQFVLHRALQQKKCDMLFAPGGSYVGSFRPFVTMSRNLLPFAMEEARRFGLSWTFLRLMLLRRGQAATFHRAAGVIYLTEYARDVVWQAAPSLHGKGGVIYHGVHPRFLIAPRPQKLISAYSTVKPLQILYVSIINMYKHQWHVAEAVARLRKEGFPIELRLVGRAYSPALKKLQEIINRLDPQGQFIRYLGSVPHAELRQWYESADIFLFASTCETFGQIMTEGMAAGLPIACGDTGTMREIVGDNAVYFDPEQPITIANAIRKLILDVQERERSAIGAYQRAQDFTWERCAQETFRFLAQVARDSLNKPTI